MTYKEYLETKKHSTIDIGIDAKFIPENMFDFQKHIALEMIRKGRFAGFIDTVLEKKLF